MIHRQSKGRAIEREYRGTRLSRRRSFWDLESQERGHGLVLGSAISVMIVFGLWCLVQIWILYVRPWLDAAGML